MGKYMSKVFGVFSEDLGIDLGTSNTLICMKNKGIVLNELSVVAINTKTKEIFEVGERAKKMIGRTPANYETIKPLRNGVIADYEITEKMLRSFYQRVNSSKFWSSPRVIICVPAGITQVEKRAVIDVTIEAGAREAYLIEEPMAAAIGIGLDIFQPEGNMVVDIGGGTSELAVISLGGIIKKSSFKVAGDKFDEAIIEFLRSKYNLLVGETTAEDIKKNIGAVADVEDDDKMMTVSGRNILTRIPKDINLYSSELLEPLNELVAEIVDEIKNVFEKTPPELASDIKKHGLYLSGGGALLRGLDTKISQMLNIKVVLADDPLNGVINGINVLLQNFKTYKRVLVSTETDY